MSADRAIASRFRFGRFELDVRARELRTGHSRLRLQDQPFEILLMLVQKPGEVLTREALRRQLWPDGTFVDFEHGLNATVKRLRAALGDDAEHPQFVETLRRRGYRFVAPVESIEPAVAREGAHEAAKVRLAVLPFAMLGTAHRDETLLDGLAEEIITALGRVPSARFAVVARPAATSGSPRAQTVRDIGRAVQVGYLIEGSVRCAGDRIRINAQLVETDGETQVWAASYDRQLSAGVFVESQVASAIAEALAIKFASGMSGDGADAGGSASDAVRQ